MKNFKLTDAHIVITLFAFAIALFVTIGMIHSGKPEQPQNLNFTGIDAAGFKHYPNGQMERMEVKLNAE